MAKKLSGVRPPSLPFLAQETKASARRGAKRTLNDNFREVRPLARIVLVAGFEAFNLQLYKQVVSTRGGSLRGFHFSFSILYPVRLLFFWFWVLGLRLGLRSPLLYFPYRIIFLAYPFHPGGGRERETEFGGQPDLKPVTVVRVASDDASATLLLDSTHCRMPYRASILADFPFVQSSLLSVDVVHSLCGNLELSGLPFTFSANRRMS